MGGPTDERAGALLGRRAECDVLDALLADVADGTSRVLVLRGEAGAGKTALLGYLGSRAEGCRVLSAVGVESEMELAYGALHQLCLPVLDLMERLPDPQRDALGVAFGLRAGAFPGGAGGAEPVVGRGRGAAAAVRGR